MSAEPAQIAPRVARSLAAAEKALRKLGAVAFELGHEHTFELARAALLELAGDSLPQPPEQSLEPEAPKSGTAQRTMTAAERAAAYRARRAQRHAERDGERDASRDGVTPNVTASVTARHATCDASRDGGDKGGATDVSDSPEKSKTSPLFTSSTARDAHAAVTQPAAPASRDGELALRVTLEHDGTLDAFVAGVRSVTGTAMTALTWRARSELVDLVIAHAAGESDREAWLLAAATEFARAHDPTYGGFTPRALARWLDAGRPSGRKPNRPPVQRYEGSQFTADELARVEVF